MIKKLGLLLSVVALTFVLVACGGEDSPLAVYVDEHEEDLVAAFEAFGVGDASLSTSGNNEFIVRLETTADRYETMSGMAMFDSAGDAIEAFINDTRSDQIENLATAMANEIELDTLTIRVIVDFDGDELTNMTFTSR